MSVDDFDPGIERLFNRAPVLPDAPAFEARVMGRLHSNNRMRGLILSAAGIAGGVFAAKEMVGLRFKVDGGQFEASTGDSGEGLSSAVRDGGQAVQGLVDGLGLGSMDLGSMGQTQTFLGAAVVLIAVLTIGAVKLYQQV